MSYCDCDYTAPTFFDKASRKARKVHRCDECFGPIHPGETYEAVAGMWEGDFQTYKTCPLCLELRQWAKISMPCFCHAYSELHDNVREMVDDIKHTVPGIVFECGRRIIKIERRKYREHWPRRFKKLIFTSAIASGVKPYQAMRTARDAASERSKSLYLPKDGSTP